MGFLIGGIMILTLYCFIVWKSISPAIKNPPAEVNHEAMLVSVFPFTLLMPISIFLFGWTSRADIHWAIPLIATILFVIGLYMIFQVTFAYLATIYPRYLASVFAGNDLFRAVMGAAFPLFAKALFERTATPRYPVGWGCSLLGFLTAIFILAPVLIHRYGAHLRARSKYALS
jgi:MFS transporter, DHA1 family, multidrug resistance protein